MAYDLLQEFFAGRSIDILVSLLQSQNLYIRRSAIWIASELGSDAKDLLPVIIKMVDEEDRYVLYHILDVIAVLTANSDYNHYIHVLNKLDSSDEVVRRRAMWLMTRANEDKLNAVANEMKSDDIRYFYLTDVLLNDKLNSADLIVNLSKKDTMLNRYSAIALKRKSNIDFNEILSNCVDEDVQYLGKRGNVLK